MNRITLLFCLLISILLSACSSDEHQDVKEWMKDASKDIRGRVLPLPEIKPFPIVSYEAADLLNPFSPSKIEPEKKVEGGGGGIKPDFNRFREPLEGYPLESLKMVGLLKQGKMTNAIIRADNKAYLVKIGNYLGQNFGMIVDITDSEVQLKELVQDSSGDWVERTGALQLQEQETKK
jgi:type IV pilus assembly protein PilP